MLKQCTGILIILLFIGCNSVHRINKIATEKHPVEILQKEVDKTYLKLKRNQPEIYQYTSKERLDFLFDSFKKSIKNPMLSREFSFQLAQVVSHIRQGHTVVYPPFELYTQSELRQRSKFTNNLNKLVFDYVNDTLFVRKSRFKDSLYLFHQLLKINQEPIEEFINRNEKTISSDGFNQSFKKKIIGQRIMEFYGREYGFSDSISLTFQNKDSIFTVDFKPEKIQNKVIRDSIKPAPRKYISSKQKRQMRKEREEVRSIKGWNSSIKEYNRELEFIGKNKDVAYLKIRKFTIGDYKSFYDNAFKDLYFKKTQNLIIDLRDNTGGRLDEIDYLYSYLTDKNYRFLMPSEVTSRTSIYSAILSSRNFFAKLGGIISTPILLPFNLLKVHKKDGKFYYNFRNNTKEKSPAEKHYDGKIYVLINGTSFSASCILSSILQGSDRATFIGQETGGDYNGSVAGAMRKYSAPKSLVTTMFGIFFINSTYQREEKGRGVFPDIELESTYKQITQNIDAPLDWVLKDIQN